MPGKLDRYRAMRDFSRTAEPDGSDDAARESDRRFVIQEHHATALHWDFRLERDGVLVSWAVPKGLPAGPKMNNLAIHTEDHPLSYLDFEGEIPKDEYGGGEVYLWDTGTYEEHKFNDREVMVTLHGKRVQGKYVLFKTEAKNWMVHRMDPPQDPTRESMPERIEPMLAKAGELPRGEKNYGFEIKWDGVRAIAYVQGGRIRLQSRRMLDVTKQYPEMAALGERLGATEVVLDGEIVAFEESGRPSFELLQQRMNLQRENDVRRKMKTVPVSYMIFDLLYLDGHSTCDLPYQDRRRLLDSLELEGPNWKAPAYHQGDGKVLLEATKARNLEGLVAKRLDSTYQPGKRTGAWVKVKNQLQESFVIGGYTHGEGSRGGTIGALLLGCYDVAAKEATRQDRAQRLSFSGRVGTGFSDAFLRDLAPRLEALRRETSPFGEGDPGRGVIFVEPRMVCEVAFTERTNAKVVRHPTFRGLRPDEDPVDVVCKGIRIEPEAGA